LIRMSDLDIEFNGEIGLDLNNKRSAEITVKNEKIIFNITKISSIKPIIKLVKKLSESSKDTSNSNGKDILEMVDELGYSVKIKLKGITIIKNLKSSRITKLKEYI